MAVDGPDDTQPTFAELGLPEPLVRTLADSGITTPFPIQAETVPDVLAGRDVLGKGSTGSGKTYAFALPLLARIAADGHRRRPGRPRALVLAPTRELATQIQAAMGPLAAALNLRTATVFGGVRPGPQIAALRKGVDVLVACPGRLTDHMDGGHVSFEDVQVTVLDEADQMADLGFLPIVRRLLDKTSSGTQRLLFSATLDGAVHELVRRYLDDPVTHTVAPQAGDGGELAHHLLHVRSADRLPILADLAAAPGRALVFTRTKRGATRLAEQLSGSGVRAVELHGDLAQRARDKNLAAFSSGRATTLVATDIAARGIHVDDVTLVIHADPPHEHKAYLHRSGRTGRAGASGTVVTLMTDEQAGAVTKLTRKAGVQPQTTKATPTHPILRSLAPGERTFESPAQDEGRQDEGRQDGRQRGQRDGTRGGDQRGGNQRGGNQRGTGRQRNSGNHGEQRRQRSAARTGDRKRPDAGGRQPAKSGTAKPAAGKATAGKPPAGKPGRARGR